MGELVLNKAYYTIIFLAIALVGRNNVVAQCSVNLGLDVTINCGESIDLSATGSGNVPVLSTDFDNGQAGPGWASNGGQAFAQPCGPGPSNSPYYWASTAGNGTPGLATVGFDVSCGATVSFDMAYSAQGGAAPCEGPDLPNEGVSFEYSLDGGATWIVLEYWDPNGGNDPMLTAWNTYNIIIPPAAWGPSTMFQWTQANSSGACCDNWGIDNVLIIPGLCGGGWEYDWSNIPGTNDPTQQTVSPMTTTQYSIILSDGTDFCYDTINVIVTPLVASATTSSANIICPDCANLEVVFTNNNSGSIIDDFDPVPDMLIWDEIENGTAGVGCNSMSGNALHFDGTGTDRFATTVPINSTICGMANFCIYMGNAGSGGAPCENADAGEDVVFEYSTNAGATWTIITTYDEGLWDANNSWQCFVVPLPPPAQTLSTMFRWRQTSFSSCNGCDNWSLDNVSIACTPPTYDCTWSPAAGLSDPLVQNPIACPIVPTTYTATLTDPNTGCSATDDVYIDVVCQCTIDQLNATLSQCENGNTFTVSGDFIYIENPGTGTIEIEITNASGTYTQTINGPFVNQQLTNYSISGIIADGSPLTIDVYFSDDLACTAQLVDISPELPTLSNMLGGAVYCPGDVVTDITVDVSGNGPFTVDYTLDGVPQNIAGAGPTISLGTTEGVYVVTAINDQGCTNAASGTETISLQPIPTVISMTGGDSYCENVPIDDIVLELTGTGPWTVDYTIDGNLYTLSSAVSPMSLGNIEGVYLLTQISDANCSDLVANTDEITINPAPIVNAGADFISCDGDVITLTASGAQAYAWDNGVMNGVAFLPSGTNTYTVVGTDPNGCQDTDEITVTVELLPEVAFVADQTIGCAPFPVVFTNSTPGNLVDCQWDFGNGTTGAGCNLVANVYGGSGTFDVTLTTTSFNGCVNSVTYDDYVYVENDPLAGFIPSSQQVLSLDTEVAFDNTTTGAVNYIWDFGDNSELSYNENPIHEFPGDQTSGYLVTLYAYSPIGCVDSITIVIQVNEEVIFYIPNTFTPDGDEFNQHFQPVFTAGFDPFDFNLEIYNRWGEVVFESNDPTFGWDGTYHGRVVQDGTYSWRVEFKTISSDERMVVHGHVNIIR